MAKHRKTRRLRKHRGGEGNQIRSRLRNNINKAKAIRRTLKNNNNLAKNLDIRILESEQLASKINNSSDEVSLKEQMNIKANNLEKLLSHSNENVMPASGRPMNTKKNFKTQVELRTIQSGKNWAGKHRQAAINDPQSRGLNNTTRKWNFVNPTMH
jgi:hypothetical protein